MANNLVIFDCNGVLVDSEPIVNRLLVETLVQEGLPLSIDEVDREFFGLSWPATLDIIEARLGRPVAGDFLDRIQRASFDAFRRELRPMPGIEAALGRIGQPVCVASSGEPAKIRHSLELTGLCQRRSKKRPPWRSKKGPPGGCGLVPVVHGRAPRATRRALNRLTRRCAREGPVGPRGQARAGWSVQLAVGV